MGTQRSKSNFELMTTDLFTLSDSELSAHIQTLQIERNNLKRTVVPSVSECNEMISLARMELSSRSSEKLARSAHKISIAATLLALAALGWAVFAFYIELLD